MVLIVVTGCQVVVVIMASRVKQTTLQCSDGLVMGS